MPPLTVRGTVQWCAAGRPRFTALSTRAKVDPRCSPIKCQPAVAAASVQHAGAAEQQQQHTDECHMKHLQHQHSQLRWSGPAAGAAAAEQVVQSGCEISTNKTKEQASTNSLFGVNGVTHDGISSDITNVYGHNGATYSPDMPVAVRHPLATADAQAPHVQNQKQHQHLQQQQDSARQQHTQQQRSSQQQVQQRWQQRRQQKQLRQRQQQVLQQRHQQLQQCSDWQQLLLLAADITALQGSVEWLIAVALKAVELHQPVAAAAAASVASSSASLEDAIAAAAHSSAAQHHHQSQQQQRFIHNLLMLLGSSMHTAAVISGRRLQSAAAAAPRPLQLCQLLTQLAHSRILLPRVVQQQLAEYIMSRCRHWQPLEVAAVVVGLARSTPSVIAGQSSQISAEQQQQLLDKAVRLLDVHQSGVQTQVSAKQAAVLLWAAASLKWRPSQQWVLAAAAAVVEQVQECSAAELSMALWGMGCLGVDMLLLRQALQQQQVLQPDNSRGSSIEQPGASQQQVLQRPVALAPEKLLQAVFAHAASFSAQGLLQVLWATAQIPLLPQRQLVGELLQHCQQPAVLQQYTAVDLACILWSLSKMQQQHDLEGLQQQQQQLDTQKLHLYKQRQRQRQQTSHSARAQLGTKPLITQQQLQPYLDAMMLQLPASSVSIICNMLYYLAVLGVKPPGKWLHRVLQHVQVHMSSLSPAAAADVISAVAEMRFLPHPTWLKRFYAITRHMLDGHSRNTTDDSSGSSRGAAADSSSSSPADGDADVHSSAISTNSSSSSSGGSGWDGVQRTSFTPAELALVAGAVQKISRLRNRHFPGQKPPVAWLDALAAASADVISSYSSQADDDIILVTAGALSLWGTVVKRFSRLAGEHWPGPGRVWWECYITASEQLMASAIPWDLANVLHAVAFMQKQYGSPPDSWVQAALQATQAVLGAAAVTAADAQQQQQQQQRCYPPSAADIVLIGRSFAQLGVLPDEHWRQLWVSAVEAADAGMTRSSRAAYVWTQGSFASMQTSKQHQPHTCTGNDSITAQQGKLHQQQAQLNQLPAAATADRLSTNSNGSSINGSSDSSMYTLVKPADSTTDGYEDEYEEDEGISNDKLSFDAHALVVDGNFIAAGDRLGQQLQ